MSKVEVRTQSLCYFTSTFALVSAAADIMKSWHLLVVLLVVSLAVIISEQDGAYVEAKGWFWKRRMVNRKGLVKNKKNKPCNAGYCPG